MSIRGARRRLAGLVALVAAVGLSLAGALGATAQEADPVAAPEQPVPTLTAAEAERAKAIVLGSPFLKQFRLKETPQVAEVGVWHTDDLEKLGAVVRLQLPAAVKLKGVFPFAKVKPKTEKGRAYSEEGLVGEYEGVTSILAVVDLGRNTVVRLHPGPRAGTDSAEGSVP